MFNFQVNLPIFKDDSIISSSSSNPQRVIKYSHYIGQIIVMLTFDNSSGVIHTFDQLLQITQLTLLDFCGEIGNKSSVIF